MLKRAGCLLGAFLVAHVIAAGAAGADTVDIVVDSSPITLEKADNGAHTAKVTLINTSDQSVTVEPSIEDADEACDVTPEKNDLGAGGRASFTFTLTAACDTDGGKEITLTFVGDGGAPVNPSTTELKTDPPKDGAAPDWKILWQAGAFAGGATSIALFSILIVIVRLNEKNDDDEHKAARKKSYTDKQHRINAARSRVGDDPHAIDETTPARPAITWGTKLPGLGTNWSFKEAWVSNATAGAAALVGIVAATDVLNAILGDDAKNVIGLVAVVAGIAFILVNLGPLVLKAIGDDTGVPTVGGMITAAIVVLLGTFFQLSALTIQSGLLVEDDWIRLAIGIGGITIALLVLVYSIRSFHGLLPKGMTTDAAKPSDAERAAWIVFRALSPDTPLPPLTPLEVEELLAADTSARRDVRTSAATKRRLAPKGAEVVETELAPEAAASIVMTSVAAALSSAESQVPRTALL